MDLDNVSSGIEGVLRQATKFWNMRYYILQMGQADSESSLNDLNDYVDLMLLADNHDPDKFMKKKKVLPVARISEETFETFLEKDLVFVNFFAPW